MPRDRDGEFEPQLVKKNQTTLTGDIEEKIISMYAKGYDYKRYRSAYQGYLRFRMFRHNHKQDNR